MRHEEKANGTADLVVVGIDLSGHERPLARIEDAGVSHLSGRFHPAAAVTTSGLLVFPRQSDRMHFHWEIINLSHPASPPAVIAGIEPDIDQMTMTPYYPAIYPEPGRLTQSSGVFWGPGEQLAIQWFERTPSQHYLSFVTGRTGDKTTVAVPDVLEILPYWASDGSGVFVQTTVDRMFPIELSQILRPDGSVAEASASTAQSTCKVSDQSGAKPPVTTGFRYRYACFAPDYRTIVARASINGQPVDDMPWARLIDPGSDSWVDVEGAFAGWLKVNG